MDLRRLVKEEFLKRDLKESPAPPIESTIEFIKSIPRAIRLGVTSSDYKERIDENLKRIGIKDRFEVITSGAEDVCVSKPNPHIYVYTLGRLNLSYRDCWAVEDTLPGVQAAKSAGMRCIALLRDHNRYQHNALRGTADLSTEDLGKVNPEGLGLFQKIKNIKFFQEII